jgi:hypothetical protein
MLPIRNKTIFKSRWWALAWAGGILWSAVDFAGTPSSKPAATGNAATPEAPDDRSQTGDSQALSNEEIAGAKAAVQAFDAVK